MLKRGKALRGFLALALAVGLVMAWAPGGAAAQPDGIPSEAVPCASIEELALVLNTGGAAYLTEVLYVPKGETSLVAKAPATVYMGDYGICAMGGDDWMWPDRYELDISGPVEFIGNGWMFLQGEGGHITFGRQVVLRAQGDGACAFVALEDDMIYSDFATIYASGTGACGVLGLGYDFSLNTWYIYADDGAVPVCYENNALARYCRLENLDGGVIFQHVGETRGKVITYSCETSSVQEDIYNPPLTKLYVSPGNRWHFFMGDPDFDLQGLIPDPEVGLMAQYDVSIDWMLPNETMFTLMADWDTSEYDGIDINVPGVYTAYGTANVPFKPDGQDFDTFYERITIVDPSQAWLTGGGLTLDWDGNCVADLWLMADIEEADRILLWCCESTDDGWGQPVEVMAQDRAEFHPGDWPMFSVGDMNPDSVYRFQVEVVGGPMAGCSNYLEVWYSEDGGGDRDLGDRDPGDWGDTDEPAEQTPPGKENTPPVQENTGGQANTGEQANTDAQVETPAAGTGQRPQAPAQAPAAQPADAASAEGQAFKRQHLLDLMEANPQKVALFVGDIRVALQTDALRQLLSEAESLNVDAGLADSDSLYVRIWADGALVDFVAGGVEVAFAWPVEESAGDIYLVSAANGTRVPASYRDGVLSAAIEALGEYTIVCEAKAPAPEAEVQLPSPLVPPQNTQASGGWPYLAILVPIGLAAMAVVAMPVGLRWRQRRRNRQ